MANIVKRHVLTNQQAFRMYSWVLENKDRVQDCANAAEVAALFNEKIKDDPAFEGKVINANHIVPAIKEHGIVLRSFRDHSDKDPNDKIKILSAQIAKICEQLGIELDPDIKDFAAGK